MKIYVTPTHTTTSVRSLSTAILLIIVLLLPSVTFAATSRPTCSLDIRTVEGVTHVKNGTENIFQKKGSEIQILWNSTHAKTGVFEGRKKIARSGTSTIIVDRDEVFHYRFSSGTKKVTCAVAVHIASGSVAPSSRDSHASKPILRGTAEGVKKVYVALYKDGSTSTVFASKAIKVTKGKWKSKISKELSDGTYKVVIYAEKNLAPNIIGRETITVGKRIVEQTKTDAMLVVVPVPLLLGGTTRSGMTVPVSYLQIINVGKETTSLTGFTVQQTGSLTTDAIVGFTAVDDSESAHGTTENNSRAPLFKDGSAMVPLALTLLPGQTRLVTIKAVLGGNASVYLGTQLKIIVTGVETDAGVRNAFPIRGTTWTIGV
jgi:hypothetical protein